MTVPIADEIVLFQHGRAGSFTLPRQISGRGVMTVGQLEKDPSGRRCNMRQKVPEGLKDALEGEEVLPIAARKVAQFTIRSRQTNFVDIGRFVLSFYKS
jgi:hypothetical protein